MPEPAGDTPLDPPHGAGIENANSGMAPGSLALERGVQNAMMKLIRNFVRDEKGEDLIEYGLLAAFVAAVAIFVLTNPSLKNALQSVFSKVATDLGISF
jgi:Flp pilus assembly pilin Flp